MNYETVSKDRTGRSGYYGIFSEQLTSSKYDTISAQFSYGLSDNDVNLSDKEEINGGTISLTDWNLLTAKTGTNTAGEASIVSTDRIRYRAWTTCLVQFTAQFENNWNPDSEAWIWPFNGINGFRVGYKDWNFTFQTLKDWTVTKEVTSDEFNEDKPAFDERRYTYDNLDPTALNIYRITYWYLGSAPATLEVMWKEDNNWYPLHTFYYNDTPGTNIDTPYLPIRLLAKNTGNNTDISVSCGSFSASVLTEDISASTRYFQEDLFKQTTDETEEVLFNFRNKETFSWKTNHIRADLINSNTVIDTSDIVKITVYKNATISGASYADEDTTNSVIEYDTVWTFTGGEKIYVRYLTGQAGSGSNSWPWSSDISLWDLWLNLRPWETATVTTQKEVGTGSYSIGIALNWKELF